MRFCLLAYPCQVWGHRWFTPCLVSVVPLSRVLERGTLHSTGMSRFIASPGPVPLQRPPLHRFCDVAGAYSGTACPRESLHARVTPLPLFGSRLAETPGARQALSLACTDAWLARRSKRSADTQTVPFSGLCVRCSASTLHLAEHPLLSQWFRAVGSTLPGKASVMRISLAYFPSQEWLRAWLTDLSGMTRPPYAGALEGSFDRRYEQPDGCPVCSWGGIMRRPTVHYLF